MSTLGGRHRGSQEHSVEEACPEEGGVKTPERLGPQQGGFWSPLDGAHTQQHLWYLAPPRNNSGCFSAFPSVVFALTSVSFGVVGAGTAPGGRLAMRACGAGWAAGLSGHSRQLQAAAASDLRGTGRRGGRTVASGLRGCKDAVSSTGHAPM